MSIIIVFISCNVKKESKISCIVFDISGLNSEIKSINKQGFTLVPDDIIVYEKVNKDTTVYINVHRKIKKIENITWGIKLKDSSKSDILNYLKNKGVTLLTPIKDTKNGYSFKGIRREKENVIFYFELENSRKSTSLIIIYYKQRENDIE